jgi:hypothetical protein
VGDCVIRFRNKDLWTEESEKTNLKFKEYKPTIRYNNQPNSKFKSFVIFLPKQPALLLITKYGILVYAAATFSCSSFPSNRAHADNELTAYLRR